MRCRPIEPRAWSPPDGRGSNAPRLPFDEGHAESHPPAFEPPDRDARAFAVDPRNHVVLEASAGTGKTSVLVRRYLNLLEAGVDPSHILAITFTRRAAAEMRERILGHLKRDAQQSAAGRARWRTLRDRAGDIAISTIDAFCLSLLREFPLEADLDPGFRMADDTEVARLVSQALDHALRIGRSAVAADPALATVFAHLSPAQIRAGLTQLLSRRLVAPAALAAFLRGAPAVESADDAVRASAARLVAALDDPPGSLSVLLSTGPVGAPRFRVLVRGIEAMVRREDDAVRLRATLSRLHQYALTLDGEPRRRPHGYRADDYPDAASRARHLERFTRAAAVVFDESQRLARDLNVVLARGVQRLVGIALRFYRQSLDELDVLDFSETLERAVQMLERMDEFSRSRFRLESRYQHVLVDEFQDTSQMQWRLVSLLIESWREGAGAATGAIAPTIFVVGDRKQSIYRFRDADVAILRQAGRYISALRPGTAPVRAISTSFRSRPELLAFVNDLFDEVATPSDRNDAFRFDAQDRFPVVAGLPMPLVREPVLGLVVDRSPAALAESIADEIARLLASQAVVRDRETGVPRAIEPGDIAVLFRSRDAHRDVERALGDRAVPTYVYRGLGFFESDEVQDLVALLRVLAAPHDRTAAAALLRARIARVSDAGVLALAGVLGDVFVAPWRDDVDATLSVSDRDALSRLRRLVTDLGRRVDRVVPADLLDQAIDATSYAFELRGRRLVQARENVRKLRSMVRRVQNAGYVTMARLVAHFDRLAAGDESNAVVDAIDAVSLMTMHAAKGLEFPVVFLGHLSRGTGNRAPPFRVIADAGHGEPAVSVGAFRFEADRDERRRDDEETKRLFYVAATRARDRLYLATLVDEGARVPRHPGSLASVLPPSLIDAIARDSATPMVSWTGRSGRTHALRPCRVDAQAPPMVTGDDATGVGARDLVGRLEMPPEVSFPGARDWVSPPDSASTNRGQGADTRHAVTGRLVHRLMAQRGRVDHVELEALALRWAAEADEDRHLDTTAVARDALSLLARLDVDGVLSSLAREATMYYEVPFSLRRDDEGRVLVIRGVIDALAVTHAAVTVVEIKTGAPAPWHQDQLDLYVEAARALFPGRVVSGLLLSPSAR